MSSFVTSEMAEEYEQKGVVLIPGLFSNHVEQLRRGVERNMSAPGPYAAENLKKGEKGRFFDDYCNWSRIPEFKEVVQDTEISVAAADLMISNSVQLFHDHVMAREGRRGASRSFGISCIIAQ